MNKYQEALKRLQEETTPNPYTLNHNDEDFKVLQELVDKATPKKVKIMSDYAKCHYVQSYEIYVCPVCGLHLSPTQNYCDRCSQKLDWSDENE